MLAFPLAGVDAEQPFDMQPQGTTPEALNVCSVDPTTNRARGGSRPGLGRFLPPLATLGTIQHLQIIVDPQADALTADFGELPIGDLVQFEWIDDPTGNGDPGSELNRYGVRRNIGQVRRRGSGRETGFNIRKSPTKIVWSDPADMTSGEPLSGAQLNAAAVESPGGIIPVAGTFEYSPASGTVLSVGRATLNVKFTPTDDGFYKGAMGRATVNVTRSTPTIVWANPADITQGTPLGGTQLNAVAKHPVTLAVIAGTYTYTPPSGTVLPEADDQVLSVHFVPNNTAAFDTPADKTVLIDVTAGSEPGPLDVISAACVTLASEGDPTGACSIEIVLTSGTITVAGLVDPGTVTLPNTNPDWGDVADDSFTAIFTTPEPVSVRLVGATQWYYYLPPF